MCGAVGDMRAGEHISVWVWLGICVRGSMPTGVAYPRYTGIYSAAHCRRYICDHNHAVVSSARFEHTHHGQLADTNAFCSWINSVRFTCVPIRHGNDDFDLHLHLLLETQRDDTATTCDSDRVWQQREVYYCNRPRDANIVVDVS